jgi:hypothetical protein
MSDFRERKERKGMASISLVSWDIWKRRNARGLLTSLISHVVIGKINEEARGFSLAGAENMSNVIHTEIVRLYFKNLGLVLCNYSTPSIPVLRA